jgi:MFS family permease
MDRLIKNRQYFKFCMYGFLKNLRFFDAFFILFLVDKGISYTQIGILYAVREISTNLLELPSGLMADSFGRKTTLVTSFVAYISSFTIFYLFSEFWMFLAAFLLFGVGEAFRSGTHQGMIMDYLELKGWKDRSVYYYGHTRSWSQKGSAISALLAGALVFSSGSYQLIFLYSTIPYLLNTFNILTYPTRLNRPLDRSKEKKGAVLGSALRTLIGALKQPLVFRTIYSSAAHTAYLRTVKDYIQLVMINLALILPILLQLENNKKNGIVVGVLYFFIYLATSLASKSSHKLAKKKWENLPYITLLAGFGAGFISGLLFQHEIWILSLLAFAAIYIVENIRKPILTGAVADLVPNEILTSVISAQALLRTIITALLALVFGLIADHSGPGVSLISVSALLVLTAILINFIRNPRPNKA